MAAGSRRRTSAPTSRRCPTASARRWRGWSRRRRLMDSLFLRQVWAGNEAMLQELSHEAISRTRATPASPADAAHARLHYFLINKGPVVAPRSQPRLRPGASAQARGRQLLSGRRDQGGGPELARLAVSGEAKARRDRLLHDHPPRRPAESSSPCRTASSTRESWRGPQRCCARRQPTTTQPTLKKFLTTRADAFLIERLLRERRGLDGARRRRSSRPSAPTRSTRTSGSTPRPRSRRSSRCATTRRRRSCRRSRRTCRSSRTSCRSIPKYRNPQLGALAPDPRRQRRVRRRRRQPRRADRRLQPAQRRARREGEGHQARHAEEHAGREVQRWCWCRSPRSRCRAADQKNVSFDAFFTHILMHELMHGLGPHNITVGGRATTVRQELKDTYSAIEEAKADVSGLWALRSSPTGSRSTRRSRRRCTRRSWRPRSARSASASTRRTAAASRCS